MGLLQHSISWIFIFIIGVSLTFFTVYFGIRLLTLLMIPKKSAKVLATIISVIFGLWIIVIAFGTYNII